MMGADEEKTVRLIQGLQREIKELVEEFEGRVVGTAGDSAFGEFDSVVNAVRCARRIQEEQSRLNAERPEDERVNSRIGIHLGDVIVEDVIRARRLVPLLIGAFLLASPAVLFRTAGVFPTAGAILMGTVMGRVWSLRTGRSGGTRVGLGIGIAYGSFLTGWSVVTNALFVLAGLIVAATGVAGGVRRARGVPELGRRASRAQ